MPFRRILYDLISSTKGAVGAIFLDQEGETVELLSAGKLVLDELRFVGAWQGIHLAQLRNLCTSAEAGQPNKFKIEFERASMMSCDLQDGYYLVLIVDGSANEGVAWRELDKCRKRLLAEM